MTDILQSAMEWLGDVFAASASQSATYRAPSQDVAVAHATRCGPKVAAVEVNGVLTTFEQVDFLVPAAELVTEDGVQLYPLKGDVVILADGTSYEVLGQPSARPYEYLGGSRSTFRIHTKQVTAKGV